MAYTRQLEALSERLAELPKTISAIPIYKQMEKIEQLKKNDEAKLSEIEQQGAKELSIVLTDYQEFLSGLKRLGMGPNAHKQRADIIQKLVHKIEMKPDTFRLHYHVGKNYIEGENGFATNLGSNTLTYGWRTRHRETKPRKRS